MPRFLVTGLVCVAAALALLAAGGCGGQDQPPSVLLIVMDTMRADHLGCYGYSRPTSPNIDALAAQATLYERAYATAPWTVPTHASLFTGKLPFAHGAHTFKDRHDRVVVAPLDRTHTTLAEVFQSEGYRTGGFVAGNVFLSENFQFDQGFATYVVEDQDARGMVDRVVDWIDTAPDDPYFLFVNFMDTHRVYNTSPRPGLLPEPAVRDQGELLDQLIEAVMPAQQPAPDHLVQAVIDQYDTAVANLDEQIGALLAALQARGRLDDTIVVLTADHGEYFGEHGLVEHSKDVYEEAVWAPLIVKSVGRSVGHRVDGCLSLADVPSLIFAHYPADFAVEQRARFTRDPGRDPVVVENYFTRRKDLEDPRWGSRFDRVRTAIYDWPYKLIRSSDGQHELYRLDTDPREAANLVAEEPSRVRSMTRRLREFMDRRGRHDGRSRPEPLTRQQEKRLRSLGYIGG